ncbi:hypothetical protein SAMN04487861_1026 [Selenomonas ruminantium]|uniref:Uncharacterized protein n=1 Tax=Selenomonas ruminantium TaxID=971 RepID=A0A1I3BY57_SELRU|nr:hypothetical protein [Selenomonas ruminantium]SFH67143.1 hypothetical protein SAMN04487861_1026 [Selenomonas ruminantium]
MCELSCVILFVFMSIEGYIHSAKTQMFIFLAFCLTTVLIYSLVGELFGGFSVKFDNFFSVFVCSLYLSYSLCLYIVKQFKFKINLLFSLFEYKYYFAFVMIFSYIEIMIGIYYVSTSSYAGLRALINANSVSLHSGITSAMVTSIMFMEYEFFNRKKVRIFIAFTLFFLAILSTSKIFILLAIIYIVPWYTKWYHMGVKQSLFMLFIIIGCFMMSQLLLGKVAEIDGSSNAVVSLTYTMMGYYLGGLASFQLFLDGIISSEPGWVRTGAWLGNVYSAFLSLFVEKNYLIFMIKVSMIGAFYALLTTDSYSIRYLKNYGWLALLMVFYDNMFGANQLVCFLITSIFINIFSNNFKRVRKDNNHEKTIN